MILKNAMALVKKVQADVAKEIHEELVDATPKDTGNAAANWNIGPTPDHSTRNYAGADPEAVGRSKREAVPTDAQELYIANGVPYLDALENGSSKKAPAGFIKAIIDKHS